MRALYLFRRSLEGTRYKKGLDIDYRLDALRMARVLLQAPFDSGQACKAIARRTYLSSVRSGICSVKNQWTGTGYQFVATCARGRAHARTRVKGYSYKSFFLLLIECRNNEKRSVLHANEKDVKCYVYNLACNMDKRRTREKLIFSLEFVLFVYRYCTRTI